jgi:hypothetical protein
MTELLVFVVTRFSGSVRGAAPLAEADDGIVTGAGAAVRRTG